MWWDGQQRLTTLSLIPIKLRHLAKQYGSKLAGWVDSKIAGQSGFEQEFWMNHIGHEPALQALFDGLGSTISHQASRGCGQQHCRSSSPYP
jgi:hypothetical protein